MAHWRDGGIGNTPGSDDRPIWEWTLLERLASIATAQVGGPMPKPLAVKMAAAELVAGDPETGVKVLLASNNWGDALSSLCQEAFDEIQRLRAELAKED